MLNSNFPMVGGLAMQGASVRPQQLATGGLAYNAPTTSSFNPYTYGQGGNGGWLFWKPPAPTVVPAAPDPATQPTGGLGGFGGLGGGVDDAVHSFGGNGRSASFSNLSPGATGLMGGAPATASIDSARAGVDDSSTHGDHTANPGGFSSKGIGEGLATFGPNALGLGAFGLPSAIGMAYGIANNNPSLSFAAAIRDAFGWGGDGGSAGWGGGTHGDAGIGGDGVGNGGGQSTSDGSQGDTAATGGLITGHGVRRPYAHGGLTRAGLIQGPGGGQDDRVPMTVPADSYVIPADVVSGLGDGNPAEGAARLHRAVGGRAPAMGGLSRPGVPVAVSPAEQVIPPDRVAALGDGNVDRGEKMLDGYVRNVRKHKTSKGGKHPPKARPAESYMPRGKR